MISLTLFRLGFLGGLFCGDGPLKLCNKLKIWYVSTHRYLVLKNIPFSTKAPLILLMSTFFLQKISNFCTFYRPCVRNSATGLLRISHKLEKRQWLYNLPTWPHRPIFFDVVVLFLSRLITGPSFMSVSLLIQELWQFSFIRDWPEIRKYQIALSEFCPIFGEWGELGVPNLAQIVLMKCFWMPQNARDTVFLFRSY